MPTYVSKTVSVGYTRVFYRNPGGNRAPLRYAGTDVCFVPPVYMLYR